MGAFYPGSSTAIPSGQVPLVAFALAVLLVTASCSVARAGSGGLAECILLLPRHE